MSEALETLMPDSAAALADNDGDSEGTQGQDQGKDDGAKGGKPDAGTRSSVTEKRLADTEAALKAKQAEFTRISQDLSTLKEQFAEAKGQLSVLTAKPAEPDEKDWLQGDQFSEKAIDEAPGKALPTAIQNMRGEFVKVLEARDAYFKKVIADLESKLADASPERASVADVIDEFKDKAWFRAMPREAQVAFAKEEKAKRDKGDGDGERRSNSDSPAGSGRRVVKQKPSDGMSDAAKAYLEDVVKPLDKRDDTSLL